MIPTKALIVDDDGLICWALEKGLSGAGLSAVVVETGKEALAELDRHTFDLVFLDIHLPDANGFELIPRIEARSPGARIIIISGDASDGNRQLAFNGGAVLFLEKPFDLSEVNGMLMSVMNEKGQQRRHRRHTRRSPMRISVAEPAPETGKHDLHNLNCLMSDVGTGGLRLRTEYPLKVGQNVLAYVHNGGDPFLDSVPRQSTAEVVWVSPAEDHVTAGLKFLSC